MLHLPVSSDETGISEYLWRQPDRTRGIEGMGSVNVIADRVAMHRVLSSCDLDAALVLCDPGSKYFTSLVSVSAKGTFPNDCDPPACLDQSAGSGGIPFTVALELGCPELRPRSGEPEVGAVVVAMPEAPMHEHSHPPLRQHKIRLAWQFLDLKAISEACSPKSPPYEKFGDSPLIGGQDTGGDSCRRHVTGPCSIIEVRPPGETTRPPSFSDLGCCA